MKIGSSVSFQLIDIFRIIEDPNLTIDEKKEKVSEYQKNLQSIEHGLRVGGNTGPNNKNGFYVFGNIDEMDYESLARVKEYVDKTLSSLTCEGEMKMGAILGYDEEKHMLKFNFSFADKIYSYAREKGKDVRGHTLVWHKHEPEALDKYISDRLGMPMEKYAQEHHEDFYQRRKELTKQFLSEYIKAMGEHFPDCYAWDVLNEIVPDVQFGQCTEQEKTEGLRHSKWREYLGEDFFIEVLQIARDNLPEGTKLFYNEYGEQHPEKRKAILAVIERIKQYEARTGRTILDGIGLQSHYNLNMTPEQIEEIYHEFASTGKEIQITEADITPGMKSMEEYVEYDPQSKKYDILWTKMMGCAGKYGVAAFTAWGVCDDLSWHRDIGCTMIDKKGFPKAFAIDFLNKNKPKAETQGKDGREDCLRDQNTTISGVEKAIRDTHSNVLGNDRKTNEQKLE